MLRRFPRPFLGVWQSPPPTTGSAIQPWFRSGATRPAPSLERPLHPPLPAALSRRSQPPPLATGSAIQPWLPPGDPRPVSCLERPLPFPPAGLPYSISLDGWEFFHPRPRRLSPSRLRLSSHLVRLSSQDHAYVPPLEPPLGLLGPWVVSLIPPIPAFFPLSAP